MEANREKSWSGAMVNDSEGPNLDGLVNRFRRQSKMLQIEASPLFRAGLPGKEDGHFCIAPLDPALPTGFAGSGPVKARKS